MVRMVRTLRMRSISVLVALRSALPPPPSFQFPSFRPDGGACRRFINSERAIRIFRPMRQTHAAGVDRSRDKTSRVVAFKVKHKVP